MKVIITLSDILSLIGIIAVFIFILGIAISDKLKNRKNKKKHKKERSK